VADERGQPRVGMDRIVGATLDIAGLNDDTKSSWWWRPFVMTFTATLWIAFGVLTIDYLEGWTYHTGLYVIVQIVTTIGYGDITVTTQAAKVFMSLYVLITLLLIANVITEAMSHLIDYERTKMRRMMRRMEKRVRADVHSDEQARNQFAALNDILSSFLLFLVFVAFGTAFFSMYESCTCSFGETAVEGCEEGAKCTETGGYTTSLIDAFYMSVITLTTVGFGDHSPKTPLGRVIGCAWMLLGVAATGSLITAVTGSIWSSKKVEQSAICRRISSTRWTLTATGESTRRSSGTICLSSSVLCRSRTCTRLIASSKSSTRAGTTTGLSPGMKCTDIAISRRWRKIRPRLPAPVR